MIENCERESEMRRISCIGSIPVLLLFLLTSPSHTQAQSDSPPSSPLTDPDGVPDHTSVLSCSFPFLNYVSVSYDSMLPCTIITKSNGVETAASLGDFVIVVQNHTGLHDLKEGVGYISNITLLDALSTLTFEYHSPHGGNSELIHVVSVLDNSEITNSPIQVLFTPEHTNHTPFFSFHNELFVIFFILLLCILIGLCASFMYGKWNAKKMAAHATAFNPVIAEHPFYNDSGATNTYRHARQTSHLYVTLPGDRQENEQDVFNRMYAEYSQ